MSLADFSRFMRAKNGGWGFEDLSARVGESVAKQLFRLERKQRDVATEDLIEQMAQLYQTSVEELRWHQERSRRALTIFCTEQQAAKTTITLKLRHSPSLSGIILWHDIAAIALNVGLVSLIGLPEQTVVVQRHAVIDWQIA